MKKQNLNLMAVSLEDFDAKSLRRAAREGRLFIALPDDEPKVGDIWQAILHDADLSPLFFLTRYRNTRGKINWYRVMVVVCLLREKGIYREDISAKELCKYIEGAPQSPSHYSGMGRYQLEFRQIQLLYRILDKNEE